MLTALLAVCTALACQNSEEPTATLPTFTPAPPSDAGQRDEPDLPPPLELSSPTDACDENAIRCLASHTDRIEACRLSDDGRTTRWVQDTCSDGFVCVDNACTRFTCVPGRPTCNGLDTAGICNDEGDALNDEFTCGEDEVCRGGLCVDLCDIAEQTRSYIGCEYMVAELPNPLLELNEPFGVVVANIDPLLEATISVYDDYQPDRESYSRLVNQVEITRRGERDGSATVQSHIEEADGEIRLIEVTQARDIVLPPLAVATLLFEREGSLNDTAGAFVANNERTRRLISSRPVVAYQFNPYCCNFSYTNDASLLLPIYALGTRYTAIVPPDWAVPNSGRTQFFNGGLVVVAHEDDTQLTFTFPKEARLTPSLSRELALPSGPGGHDRPFEWSTTLRSGDMLYIRSGTTSEVRSWMTGTRVEGNKTFAAFANHECTYIPHGLAACDHLETQLTPDETWGRRYVLAPFARRSLAPSEVMYWHLLSGDQGATLTLGDELDLSSTLSPFSSAATNCLDLFDREGRRTITLPPNTDCILGTQDPVVATANQAISVVGYISGERSAEQPCGDVEYCSSGDPAMFTLPPTEQFRRSYTFLVPETYAFDFMTLILPVGAAGTVTFNGEPLDLNGPGIEALNAPGSEFAVVHVPIRDGAHRVEASAPFGLLVYAYDKYVSFAYPGGLNLTKRP
ncbi:MAG: hypothetical protein CMH57_02010 [Myxococcales bacterium]|nr:hypothetical protein [Myxococcales bacterium]